MTTLLPTTLLHQFSQFITNEMGLYFPEQKWRELERGVNAASQAFKFKNTEECMHWLMSSSLSQKQVEVLASYLTVGETYFFRHAKTFQYFEKEILSPLIYARVNNGKYLRIWSAGCASGEEPYTIAILLHRLIPDIKNWNITLLATDINTTFLRKCSKGIYSEWSFREIPKEIKNTYFSKNDNKNYEINPCIKNLVEIAYLNLSSDAYPALLNKTNAMDVIFCRNVLMYFSSEHICKIVKKFHASLVDGGYLIVAPGEAIHGAPR